MLYNVYLTAFASQTSQRLLNITMIFPLRIRTGEWKNHRESNTAHCCGVQLSQLTPPSDSIIFSFGFFLLDNRIFASDIVATYGNNKFRLHTNVLKTIISGINMAQNANELRFNSLTVFNFLKKFRCAGYIKILTGEIGKIGEWDLFIGSRFSFRDRLCIVRFLRGVGEYLFKPSKLVQVYLNVDEIRASPR